MRKLLATCLFLFMVLVLQAQKLTVKSMEVAEGDLTASVHPRNDLNGNPCALVRVMLKDSAPKFEGNVLGEVEQKGMQYMVYMSAGTKFLRIVPADHFPLMIAFGDYGIKKLEGKVTYELVVIEGNDNDVSFSNNQPFQIQREGNIMTIWVHGIPYNMISVEGGSFMMGAMEQDKDADELEKPIHKVKLSNFLIGETEVLQRLWNVLMDYNPSEFRNPIFPVDHASWDDCDSFIKKLNSISGMNFRLPTEAEWEYAARGGKHSKNYKYSGDNNLDEVAWHNDNSMHYTHPTKMKKANELGLYDMSGNVGEWCADSWYSYSSKPQENPYFTFAESKERIARGGGYGRETWECRVHARDYYDKNDREYGFGFRLALSE